MKRISTATIFYALIALLFYCCGKRRSVASAIDYTTIVRYEKRDAQNQTVDRFECIGKSVLQQLLSQKEVSQLQVLLKTFDTREKTVPLRRLTIRSCEVADGMMAQLTGIRNSAVVLIRSDFDKIVLTKVLSTRSDPLMFEVQGKQFWLHSFELLSSADSQLLLVFLMGRSRPSLAIAHQLQSDVAALLPLVRVNIQVGWVDNYVQGVEGRVPFKFLRDAPGFIVCEDAKCTVIDDSPSPEAKGKEHAR